jgi:hypothetical protein
MGMSNEVIEIFSTEAFQDCYGTIRVLKTPEGLSVWVGGRLVYIYVVEDLK